MIILIDNYDSFTFNVAQYLGQAGCEVEIHRNDKITPEAVFAKKPQAIVISPGPSNPDNAGICLDLIKACLNEKAGTPLLGICLGHQAIGQACGGNVVQTTPLHGKTSMITHNSKSVFKNLPSPLEVTRYHSLIIEKSTCPSMLEITAQTDDDIIMGIQHQSLPIHGVQFHPESIASQEGHKMIENFLSFA